MIDMDCRRILLWVASCILLLADGSSGNTCTDRFGAQCQSYCQAARDDTASVTANQWNFLRNYCQKSCGYCKASSSTVQPSPTTESATTAATTASIPSSAPSTRDEPAVESSGERSMSDAMLNDQDSKGPSYSDFEVASLKTADTSPKPVEIKSNIKVGMEDLQTKYLHHDEIRDFFRKLEQKYPSMVHMYDIGRSVKNRKLYVLAIAAENPSEHVHLRPEVKYVGNMHGDETASREVILRFAAYLLENYGKIENVTSLLNDVRVHLMPTMNPDGFENSKEGLCKTGIRNFRRQNAKGEDLNRNFPDLYHKNYRKEQRETRAVRLWVEKTPFILSANFHGGAKVVNYPYDTHPDRRNQYSKSPDDSTYRKIARAYADQNPSLEKGCRRNFKHGITNGAEWYNVVGSMQDYMYYKHNQLSVTVELSCCKYPMFKEIEGIWNNNRESMLQYLMAAQKGFRGHIVGGGGRAIWADVHIVETGTNLVTTEHGEFWRIEYPGTYNLKISSRNYLNATYRVTLTEREPLKIFKLQLTPKWG